MASAPPASPERSTRGFSVRRVVAGFAVLSFASIVLQVLGFVALAIASRKLGPENLGAYNFAYGVALYFTLPTDFGITVLGIRDMARHPERARQIMGEVMALQVVIAVISFAVMVASAPLIAADETSRKLLPIMGVFVLCNATLSFHWALRAMQRMKAVAVVEIAGQLVYFGLVATLLVGGVSGAMRFAWFHVAGAAVMGLASMWWAWSAAGTPELVLSPRRIARRFWASAPIGISFAMIQIYFSLDSLMLGWMRGTEDVGHYGVAYKLPLALMTYSSLWVAALYPHASGLFVRDRERLRTQVETFANLAVVVALPLGVGASFAADGLMEKLFGSEFGPATTPFILLTWATAIIFLSVNFGNVLLAAGDEKRYAIGVSVGALVNLLLNLIVIPRWGATGASAATVAAELTVILYMVVRFRKVMGPVRPDLQRIWRCVAACAVMAGVLIALPESIDPLVRIAAGALVYAVTALAIGAVRRDELRLLVPRRGAVDTSATADAGTGP